MSVVLQRWQARCRNNRPAWLDVPTEAAGEVTCPSFQGLDLPQKLCGECRFAPEALVTGIAAQMQVHITHSHFESTLENAQLLLA
jgi:hypothetical protein